MRESDLMSLAMEAIAEVQRAEAKHAPLNSPHEGWSVIFEELEELREHVRSDTGRSPEARREAIQIAAMGLRYALNLCAAADGAPMKIDIIGWDFGHDPGDEGSGP